MAEKCGDPHLAVDLDRFPNKMPYHSFGVTASSRVADETPV